MAGKHCSSNWKIVQWYNSCQLHNHLFQANLVPQSPNFSNFPLYSMFFVFHLHNSMVYTCVSPRTNAWSALKVCSTISSLHYTSLFFYLLRFQVLIPLRVEGSIEKEMEGPIFRTSTGAAPFLEIGPSICFSVFSFTFGIKIFSKNDTLSPPWPR